MTTPPFTFEENLKYYLVPPRLYMRYRAAKELRKGEREAALLSTFVPKEKAAVDVGANKGVYSELLSRICPKVYAFEANPKLFKMLKRFACGKVEAHHMALSDKSGMATLRIPKTSGGYSNQGASLNAHKVSGAFMPVEVKAQTLDSLNLSNIGFVKIDVEGFELSVLKGAKETLARERPVLMLEMEERHTGVALSEMVQEVENYGYVCNFFKENSLVNFSELDEENKGYVFNFVFFPNEAN